MGTARCVAGWVAALVAADAIAGAVTTEEHVVARAVEGAIDIEGGRAGDVDDVRAGRRGRWAPQPRIRAEQLDVEADVVVFRRRPERDGSRPAGHLEGVRCAVRRPELDDQAEVRRRRGGVVAGAVDGGRSPRDRVVSGRGPAQGATRQGQGDR